MKSRRTNTYSQHIVKKPSRLYLFFFPNEANRNKLNKRQAKSKDILEYFEARFKIILCIIFLILVIYSLLHMFSPKEDYIIPDTYDRFAHNEPIDHSAGASELEPQVIEDPFVETNNEPEIPISCWSDSFGVTPDSDTIAAYPNVVSSLAKRTVYNISVPEDSMEMIAARQGAIPMVTAPFMIPGEIKPVEIVLNSIDGTSLTPHFSYNGGFNPCTINGIEGIVSYIDDKLYFTRTSSGSDVIVSIPTPVITRAMTERTKDITVFFIGSDPIFDNVQKTVDTYQKMVAALGDNTSFLIVSPIHGDTAKLDAIDSAMTQYFGDKYLSLRQYLVTDAPEEYNLEINADSDLALSQGILPKAYYISGGGYFTTTISYIVGQQIYDRLNLLYGI